MRDWLSVIRSRSGLLTTLARKFITVCKGWHLRGIICKVDLDWSYYHFNQFYITDKQCFDFFKFFLILPLSIHFHEPFSIQLRTVIVLPCLFYLSQSKLLFCPFHHNRRSGHNTQVEAKVVLSVVNKTASNTILWQVEGIDRCSWLLASTV